MALSLAWNSVILVGSEAAQEPTMRAFTAIASLDLGVTTPDQRFRLTHDAIGAQTELVARLRTELQPKNRS